MKYKVEIHNTFGFNRVILLPEPVELWIDCFQTKTIPIYLGCPNIGNWFDTEGMFIVNSIDDIKNVLISIDENTYHSKIPYIENNYHKSNDFVDFGIMIENKLKKLLNEKDDISN